MLKNGSQIWEKRKSQKVGGPLSRESPGGNANTPLVRTIPRVSCIHHLSRLPILHLGPMSLHRPLLQAPQRGRGSGPSSGPAP